MAQHFRLILDMRDSTNSGTIQLGQAETEDTFSEMGASFLATLHGSLRTLIIDTEEKWN